MSLPTRPLLTSLLFLGLWLCACDNLGPPGQDMSQPSQTGPCAQSETTPLEGGAYSFRHGLYSTLFIVAQDGIIAFDPLGNEAVCLAQAMRTIAPGLLVKHVIYSHSHHDHIAGAGSLPLSPDVQIYAHQKAVEELLRLGPNSAVMAVTKPQDVDSSVTEQPRVLDLLGKRIALYYFGPTESSGNLMIHLPDHNLAMLVDVLIADSVPGTVLASMSPQGVLRTLRSLDALPFDQVVVGHGPPASHEDVKRTLAFWSDYISLAQRALAQTSILIPDTDALDGAPLLKIMPQLPVQQVVEGLRPYHGTRIGFDWWGKNGFNFAYLYLLSESPQPLTLRDPNRAAPPPLNWERVGEGAYYAQAGPYGSLVYDPDPKLGKAPLLLVDTLGDNAAYLRQMLDHNLPGRKIGAIVYSHAHNDHIAFANALVDDLSGVKIYAHENAARDLRDRKNPSVAPPTDLVLGAGQDLTIAGKTIQLRWFGPSHSDGALVVYLPGAQVAMGVGLVQKGAVPGLLSVETDPQGLYATLTSMAALSAQIYLTGQGGILTGEEFRGMVQAMRAMLVGSATAMNQPQPQQRQPLSAPVAPALRESVDLVGGAVAKSLADSYPLLQGTGQVSGNLGELGVTYCSSQSPSVTECQVR